MGITSEMVCDFTKPAKEILIDLINYSNRNSMTRLLYPNEVFFTKPKTLPRESDMNTEIRIASALGFRIPQETESILYNRIDIMQVARSMPWDFTLMLDPTKRYTKMSDLLDDLFQVFPVCLLPEDIVDEEIDLDLRSSNCILNDDVIDEYSIVKNNIKMKMSEDSIGYLGTLTFRVVPKPVNINTVIRQRKVGSFTYPRTWPLS